MQALQRYQAIAPDSRGWLWCETLGLWLGTWEGQVQREPGTGSCAWLCFYDRDGNLILLSAEQAEQEKQRAERLAERLRALGEDPDAL